jgi:hypothetical protein
LPTVQHRRFGCSPSSSQGIETGFCSSKWRLKTPTFSCPEDVIEDLGQI